jgi:hypothetical protein
MGKKWTQRDDKAFLLGYLPRYNDTRGPARARNVQKRVLLGEVLQAYMDKFPGRLATLNLSKLELGGTEEERKSQMIIVSILHGGLISACSHLVSVSTIGSLIVSNWV